MQNTDNIEEIQRRTQEEEERNEKESRWMKPAKDILTGIEKASTIAPERPIWELVQNAGDLAIGKANITFTRRDKEFDFSHDGEPFTDKTIRGLITQTSTKLRDDKTKIGQYGTGFLTTHRFGRSFELSGALYTSEGSEYFYNFEKFKINRKSLNESEMMNALAIQVREKESFKNKYTPVKEPAKTTLFRYTQDSEDEKNNVKCAFQDARQYVPYVLALNPNLQSISFIDETDHSFIRYNKKDDLKPVEENLWIQVVEISGSDKTLDKEVVIHLLKSTKLTDDNKDSRFSIILPVENNKAIKLPRAMARLFLYLPLIGTNKLGVNFIINSPVFECQETRNELWLDGTAEAIKIKITDNREILSDASDLMLEYCDTHIEAIDDAINWFRIYFTHNMEGSDDYKNFLSSLQTQWVTKFRGYEVVQLNMDKEKGKPSEIKILDRSIIDICKADDEFINNLYPLIELYYSKKLPEKGCILEWSEITEEWYADNDDIDCDNEIISVESLLQKIDEKPDIIPVTAYDNLLYIYRIIIEKGYSKNMENKKLIPSINNVFFDKDELLIPQNLSDQLISIISGFLQGEVDKFVNHKFTCLMKYTSYSQESIEKDIKIYITNKNKDIDEAEKLLENCDDVDFNEESDLKNNILAFLIKPDERNCLLEFCNYAIKTNSDSFFRAVIDSMAGFCDYEFKETVNTPDDFEYRLIVRYLVRNTFIDLTMREYDWANDQGQKEKLIKILQTVQGYEDFKKLNNNARLYLSQSGKLHFVKSLQKEANITPELKEIYHKATDKDINDTLVDNDFLQCYDYSTLVCDASDLAGEISAIIQDEKFPDIRNNPHKDIIIDLTEKITEESDLEEEYMAKNQVISSEMRYWSLLFKDIAREKEHITMFKIRQPELKQSMFRIMRATPERVRLLAKLSTNPDLEEIVEKGERAVFDKKNRESDFNFNHVLGKYIEDFLKKELDKEFAGITFQYQQYEDVVTQNQQGGQDIIIRKNDKEIFYLEIKSRWSSRPSVTMSPLQMDTSVEQQDKYALCAVNMYGSNLVGDALQKNEDERNEKQHIYPDFFEIEPRIRVLMDIGKRNEQLLEKNNQLKASDIDSVVSLTGDYRALVPQKLLNSTEAVNFSKLLEEIKVKIKSFK